MDISFIILYSSTTTLFPGQVSLLLKEVQQMTYLTYDLLFCIPLPEAGYLLPEVLDPLL